MNEIIWLNVKYVIVLYYIYTNIRSTIYLKWILLIFSLKEIIKCRSFD